MEAFATVAAGRLLMRMVEGVRAIESFNPIGTVDLYLTSLHGSERSGSSTLVHALHLLVAIMNKGGMTQAMATIESSPGMEDFGALH